MMVDPLIYYAMIAAAAFLTGLSKGGLGGTMGALVTPLMALVMPLDQAVGILLPILMLGDAFALAAHWRRWNTRLILLLLPGALVGITLGTLVLTSISPIVLKQILGVIVVIFILYRLFEQRIIQGLEYRSRSWHGWLAGGVAGFTSTLAHSGGPPVVIYLLMQNLPPTVFVATSVLFFAVTNLIKVPYYYQAGLLDFEVMLRLVWLAPLVPFGVWVGRQLAARVERRLFDRLILALLGISGVILLFS